MPLPRPREIERARNAVDKLLLLGNFSEDIVSIWRLLSSQLQSMERALVIGAVSDHEANELLMRLNSWTADEFGSKYAFTRLMFESQSVDDLLESQNNSSTDNGISSQELLDGKRESLPKLSYSRLKPVEIQQLARKLLNCPSMATQATRMTVLSLLKNNYSTALMNTSRHFAEYPDVVAIIDTLLNYPGALEELIEILHGFEGESLPMQELDQFITSLKNNSIPEQVDTDVQHNSSTPPTKITENIAQNNINSVINQFGKINSTINSNLSVDDLKILWGIPNKPPDFVESVVERLNARIIEMIPTSFFGSGLVWKIKLPEFGLRLAPPESILFFRQEEVKFSARKFLDEIPDKSNASLFIIMDITSIAVAPKQMYPQTIWIQPADLLELDKLPKEKVSAWLGRLITTQLDVSLMLPYDTHGVTRSLFFGRKNELVRLTNTTSMRGGIIMGAHQSGKTSLLWALAERLKRRNLNVVGPLTVTIAKESFQSFFDRTLSSLGNEFVNSVEDWGEALRIYSKDNPVPIFLLDEVDQLLAFDTKNGSILGREMRALQNNGQAEFYLAGHIHLREAITIEGGPFRNFAEEITLTGLNEVDSFLLIQQPIEDIGFEVSDEQAQRIYKGTAGVPVLIQEFCIQLLRGRQHKKTSPKITDEEIINIEESYDYLKLVYDYYKYGQDWCTLAIMFLTLLEGEIDRKKIISEFFLRNINLSRDKCDDSLDVLLKFGVLIQNRQGYYKILANYLSRAINSREPLALLDDIIKKGIGL